MSAILGHYSRHGVKILSKWITGVPGRLSNASLKYFDKTFILAPRHIKIELIDSSEACSLTIRQVQR